MSENTFLFEHPSTIQKQPHQYKEKTILDENSNTVKVTTIVESTEEKESGCQQAIMDMQKPIAPYTGIAVDSKVDNLVSTIALMEGTPWRVEYYQQYLGKDDEPAAFSEDRLIGYQQYRRIRNLELRVVSPLSFNHDTDEDISELTGTAHIAPFIIPNKGDMFIADIGDGRSGLIEIDAVRRLSHRRNTAYEIEYHVREYLTERVHLLLKEKSLDTYIYEDSRLSADANPLVEETTYESLAQIETWHYRLMGMYIKQFFDIETSSLSVPLNNSKRTHDVEQIKFVLAVMDLQRYPLYRRVRLQNTHNTNMFNITSIWDALVNMDWLMIDEAATKFYTYTPSDLSTDELFFNAQYSIYDTFIYPYARTSTLSYNSAFTAKAELPIFIKEDPSTNRRFIYHVGGNNDYVFSNYFYLEDVENMSKLEVLVYQYLHQEAICPKVLLQLMEASIRWDDLDRYYYIPVLVLLSKYLISGVGEVYQ